MNIILNRLHDTSSSPFLNIFWELKRQEQNFISVKFLRNLIFKRREIASSILFTSRDSPLMLQTTSCYIASEWIFLRIICFVWRHRDNKCAFQSLDSSNVSFEASITLRINVLDLLGFLYLRLVSYRRFGTLFPLYIKGPRYLLGYLEP
jgi:hypothetical protein